MKAAEMGGDYPTSWDEFVGQEQAKRQLQIACTSAKMRGVPLDPVLLKSGVAGLGKTTLALLIAEELGGDLRVISGKVKAQSVRMLLSDMSDGDVLFYDEIHLAVAGGKSESEMWLLHLLENGNLIGPLGPEDAPKISLIGATTDAGRLPKTILSRFTLTPDLVPYTHEEAAQIARLTAARLFGALPLPGEKDCLAIAQAASCNPRAIRQILCAVRDVAYAATLGNYDGFTKRYDLLEALAFLGLSEDGLDKTAQRYLVALHQDFEGVAGAKAIQDRLCEPGGLAYTEYLLMDKRLIGMTRAGRTLTQAGIKRARELRDEGVAA